MAARGRKSDGPIRWTTLGSAPYPRADEPCSGYLLQAGGANVLVDIGGGVLGPLQHLIRLEDLHAVWISHLHADHFADMPLLYYAFAFAEKPMRKIPVLGPVGWAKRVEDFVKSAGRPPHERLLPGGRAQGPRHRRDRRPADPGPGGRARRPGLRPDGPLGDHRLAYTGDSGPCDNLVTLAKGARVLVAEVRRRT